MKPPCGCCAGIEIVTPENETNRPGLPALTYRVGTYATFFETMLARLSTLYLDVPTPDGSGTQPIRPLQALTTRDPSDPSIALLDAWAVVADVLTFYQERIANEGYLRTATERRSILEMANLASYALRPGVAASVYLAFTVADGFSGDIPAGTRAQSIPGSGELPQFFETSDNLSVRDTWNALTPRLTRPQVIIPSSPTGNEPTSADVIPELYFQGVSTSLKVGDALLIMLGRGRERQQLRLVESVTVEPKLDRTTVLLQPTVPRGSDAPTGPDGSGKGLGGILESLAKPPAVQPMNALSLVRDIDQVFSPASDITPRLVSAFRPAVAPLLYDAWAGIEMPAVTAAVFAARVRAGLFPGNYPGAPHSVIRFSQGHMITTVRFQHPSIKNSWSDLGESPPSLATIALDGIYEKILPESWIAIASPRVGRFTYHRVRSARTVSMATEGYTARVTQLTIHPPWAIDSGEWRHPRFLRETTVYAQAELLPLAEEPLTADVAGKTIELDDLYDGFASGRWIIVSGERTDIPNVAGVTSGELMMIAAVDQVAGANKGSDAIHTKLTLANKGLAYSYKRDTVTIYANVAKATQGQTVSEVLGNGGASQELQTFGLHHSPLTYVSSPTAAGAQSTLVTSVNGVAWNEVDSLAGLGAADRNYITQTDDDDTTSVTFGNGVHGARLPTGAGNVTAQYRYGMGTAGNVGAGQISQLATRPLGAKAVINPLPATGGADRDDRDHARRNAPLGVMALDRLVSVQDYADFARTFAGIGKASATRLSDGRRQLVHVTIAGTDDSPIDTGSDLYQNLTLALQQQGDPFLPIEVVPRKLKLLVIQAGVSVLPDYLWDNVALAVRTALLAVFGFDQRDLGQSAFQSEAISVIQTVAGVASVDLQTFDAISQDTTVTELADLADRLALNSVISADLARHTASGIEPAELVIVTPDIQDTIILTEISG